MKSSPSYPPENLYKSHPSRGGWIEIYLCLARITGPHMSHPSRGGWIEISIPRRKTLRNSKSHPSRGGWIEITAALWCNRGHLSHPSRGGWIEIRGNSGAQHRGSSPTPHGVGGLKCDGFRECMRVLSPTPHGVGGLKSPGSFVSGCLIASHPSRGGWIEITIGHRNRADTVGSHPSRGGWIEIDRVNRYTQT